MLLKARRGPLLNRTAVLRLKNLRAASGTLHLLGTLDHAVTFAARTGEHLAGRGDFKPLFDRRFGLHFGHFFTPELRWT